ncbi:hypothetical protein niasHT_017637 [Heterodera trifolii]|uniref:Secreted protein n=1 Tax=Heterodera trifolii TaxID=157864 RepID=A0ABD2L836_9BILA
MFLLLLLSLMCHHCSAQLGAKNACNVLNGYKIGYRINRKETGRHVVAAYDQQNQQPLQGQQPQQQGP